MEKIVTCYTSLFFCNCDCKKKKGNFVYYLKIDRSDKKEIMKL